MIKTLLELVFEIKQIYMISKWEFSLPTRASFDCGTTMKEQRDWWQSRSTPCPQTLGESRQVTDGQYS